MNDELSQLDELIESDVLDALGEQSHELAENANDVEVDNNIIEDFEEELDIRQEEEKKDIQSEVINDIDMKSTDLASLLGQLLNNKTIEITIKIKD